MKRYLAQTRCPYHKAHQPMIKRGWDYLLFLSLTLFLGACGLEKEESDKAEKPIKNISLEDLVESKEYTIFKDDFDKKLSENVTSLAQIRMIPLSSLYQIIHAVPEQTTPWGCGKQQAMQMVAAANSALGRKIPALVQECNVLGNYPALINIEITPQIQALLFLGKISGFDPPLEKVLDKTYLRVGALPRVLPDYLNSLLPKGIKASLVKKTNLDKKDFVSSITSSLNNSMPLMALYVVDAEELRLHYYSVFGVSVKGDKLLVLDSAGKGVDRVKIFDTNQFINSMNASTVKEVLKNNLLGTIASFKDIIEKNLKPNEKLPDSAEIDDLGNYNFITFTKE